MSCLLHTILSQYHKFITREKNIHNMIDDEGVSGERDELHQLVLCSCDGHAFESREIQRDLHVGRSCLEPLILGQMLLCLVNAREAGLRVD